MSLLPHGSRPAQIQERRKYKVTMQRACGGEFVAAFALFVTPLGNCDPSLLYKYQEKASPISSPKGGLSQEICKTWGLCFRARYSPSGRVTRDVLNTPALLLGTRDGYAHLPIWSLVGPRDLPRPMKCKKEYVPFQCGNFKNWYMLGHILNFPLTRVAREWLLHQPGSQREDDVNKRE